MPEEFQAFIEEWIGQDLDTQYNFAPSEQGPVILVQDKRWVGRPMRWGLIPFWAKSPDDAIRLSTPGWRRSTKSAVTSSHSCIDAVSCQPWASTSGKLGITGQSSRISSRLRTINCCSSLLSGMNGAQRTSPRPNLSILTLSLWANRRLRWRCYTIAWCSHCRQSWLPDIRVSM